MAENDGQSHAPLKEQELALGIDVGGTGIKGAVVDLRTGELASSRIRLKTPHPATPAAVAETVSQVTSVSPLDEPALVGVGFPAVIKQGLVETASNLDQSWIGKPADSLLATAAHRRVAVLNDADAAGIAEMAFGAGRGFEGVLVMVTLGTGIGTSIFADGKLVPNSQLGLIDVRGKPGERRAAGVVKDRAKLSWKAWAKRVEEYLQTLDVLLWPDLIVIGGGITESWDRFARYIRVRPPVVPATLGNNAGIIGAALFGAGSMPSSRDTDSNSGMPTIIGRSSTA